MSREDYEEDDRPRRRRRSYEDDDYEAPRRRRSSRGGASGSVTGVGVITIILGSLMLLCGFCVSLGGLMAGAGGVGGGRQFFPMQVAAGILIVIALLILVFGALYLAGGIGVIQRRNWGRILTLVMAGFSGVAGILSILAIVIAFLQPTPPPGFAQPVQQSRIMAVLFYGICMLVFFTHCIMSYVVLLNSDNASEFE